MTMSIATNHNKALAEQFFDGILHADRAAMLGIVAPDLVWVVPQSAVPPYAGTHHGAAHIVDMMLHSVSQTFLPGTVRHHILLSVTDGDTVIVETNMKARQPDGREYDNFYVFIFEIRDGVISQIREHVDTAYAVRFFGGA
jgi:ketosteroid isomerase-like protein